MVSLIAATGLRIGELLALRWGALDLEIGTLAVRESVFEGKFQSPKTQQALRTIPLGPHAVKALRAHRTGSRGEGRRSRVRQPQGRAVARVEAADGSAAAGGGGGGARTCDVASVPPHSLVAAERPQRAGRRSRRSSSGTRAFRRRSTSTRTSSMRRIARRSRRSKSDCSSQLVSNGLESAAGLATRNARKWQR